MDIHSSPRDYCHFEGGGKAGSCSGACGRQQSVKLLCGKCSERIRGMACQCGGK